MEPSSKTRARIISALAIAAIVFLCIATWSLYPPSGGGGIKSSMFFSTGTVKSISREDESIDVLICRSDIFESGETVSFDFSNHAEELDGLDVGRTVSVHHWLDSRDGKSVIARSISKDD
jgi:hypothetical protein